MTVRIFVSHLGRIAVWAWIPAVATAMIFHSAFANGEGLVAASTEEPGVHLSLGVIAVIAGIVSFVGPGFYLLGRYDHRLSATEVTVIAIERRMEQVVERSIASSDRIATAIETLGESALTIECRGPGMRENRE